MTVRIKVDEDLPQEVAEKLRSAGHDVKTVHDEGLVGTPDDELWPVVRAERRFLFTADKGFANAAKHPPGSHAGIVLFRHPRESRRAYIALVDELLERIDLEAVAGAIVVVTPEGIRTHRGE